MARCFAPRSTKPVCRSIALADGSVYTFRETSLKASDHFAKGLENEGVDRIFALPGEENLDFVSAPLR